MRSLAAVVAVLAALLLGGCAESDPEPADTPTTSGPTADVEPSEPDPSVDPAQVKAAEKALRGYLRAADAGDCKAVKKRVLLPEQVDCSQIRANAGQWSAGGNELTTVRISAEVFEDSGFATVTWANGGEDTWDLQDVDGAWLVLNADAADDA